MSKRPISPVVVLPSCDRDCQMMIKNLEWMAELDGQQHFDAVVAQDGGMNRILAGQVVAAAQKAFLTVTMFEYPFPQMPRWPWGANWAWQHTAQFMQQMGRAWFWMEADCVPLRAAWLADWFGEYERCGKPLMGSIVDGRGHCNGTAIYPADFAALSPAAMKATDVAWDWEMRLDTMPLCHNTKLMCHVWGIEHGKAHPYNGPAASFMRSEDVDKWVCRGAVLFHRSKDGTLIDRLRERKNEGRNNDRVVPGGFAVVRV